MQGMNNLKKKGANNLFYFSLCTAHHVLFCTITEQCTITLQIIVLLLHVSTLLCHRQGARSQYLSKLHKYIKCSSW
jgi:hypothetical protein